MKRDSSTLTASHRQTESRRQRFSVKCRQFNSINKEPRKKLQNCCYVNAKLPTAEWSGVERSGVEQEEQGGDQRLQRLQRLHSHLNTAAF